MPELVPSLAEAYERHLGLLYTVLGELAEEGFPAHPADATDLMHDFLAESWTSLVSHYDPSQAQFTTYLRAAFKYFARKAITRSWHERNIVSSLEATRYEPAFESPDPTLTFEQSVDIDRALKALPARQREVLRGYLARSHDSERELGRRLSLSRRSVHALLADALGRLVVQFARPEDIGPGDWSVARQLWRNGLSVAAIAHLLGLTTAQVRAAQGRLLATLHARLRAL
jgi:RNA polymerase sigma factor (sigma-70 family)